MMSMRSAKLKPSSPKSENGFLAAAAAPAAAPVGTPSDGVSTASSVGGADLKPLMFNPLPVFLSIFCY